MLMSALLTALGKQAPAIWLTTTVFHAVWVGCITLSPSLPPDAILAPCPPPHPVQFIAASGSLLEHQTFPQLDTYCTHVNQNFHIAKYFQPHVLQPLITAA